MMQNNEFIIAIVLIIVFIASVVIILCRKKIPEYFNDSVGQFCQSCSGKTFNQCMACFNCVYCIDRFGKGHCTGGDIASGGYNKEDCIMTYVRDPFHRMQQMNTNYKCSYGPMQANRVI